MWRAYLVCAVYLGLFSGFLALGEAIEVGTYSFEFAMLAVVMLLATPFFAREYMGWSTDPVAERLTWLRTLPIGVPTIVRARVIAFLAAIPLNTIAFFGPIYVADAWSTDAGRFTWLMLSIIGISLLGAGITLCFEMGVRLRRWLMANLVMFAVLIAAIIGLGIWFDLRAFEQVTRAVTWNGPLVAVICVGAGGGGFMLLGRLAERLLARRELRT